VNTNTNIDDRIKRNYLHFRTNVSVLEWIMTSDEKFAMYYNYKTYIS